MRLPLDRAFRLGARSCDNSLSLKFRSETNQSKKNTKFPKRSATFCRLDGIEIMWSSILRLQKCLATFALNERSDSATLF